MTEAVALIARLGLEPHPEGGHYREIYRAAASVLPQDGRRARSAVTSIYFLLAAGERSRWHRVTSDEIWQFAEGDPLELWVAPPALDRVERVNLSQAGCRGPRRSSLSDGPGQRLHVVPPGWWQAARPLGAYTLVTCAVAPGFDFADFSFLRDDAEAMAKMGRIDTSLLELA